MAIPSGEGTFHSPKGDTVTGADAVRKRYRDDAASFQAGGESRFEVLQKAATRDLAFWTGFQIATVRLAGQDKPAEMRIRVTEVFPDGLSCSLNKYQGPTNDSAMLSGDHFLGT